MKLTINRSILLYFLGYIVLAEGGSIWTHYNVGFGTLIMALGTFLIGLVFLAYAYHGEID